MKKLILATAATIVMASLQAQAMDLTYMAYDPTIPQTEQLVLRQNMGEKNLENTALAQALEAKGRVEIDGSQLNLVAPAAGAQTPVGTEDDEYDHFIGHN